MKESLEEKQETKRILAEVRAIKARLSKKLQAMTPEERVAYWAGQDDRIRKNHPDWKSNEKTQKAI
ncbi:hypothetical protein RsTz2092_09620 [Deferribacterales bacterium RsTz2092]|nr:hypothetical protein AGMMS49941_06340 [Deferribacterales bacterium]GHU85865.1 hypothetical protein AGMMS49941_06430 [Deferribacterales bacterium]